jgi:nitroreductase
MNMTEESLITDFAEMLITTRRSILPKRLFEPGPNDEELELIFSAAASAPDHGLIRPWRFVICKNTSRELLADAFSESLFARDSLATTQQINDAKSKAHRAPFLMLVVINARGLDPKIPLGERYVSAGCAVQNVLLMAHSLGYGSSPTSGQSMYTDPIRKLFKLTDEEDPLCFISIGTPDRQKPSHPRMVPRDFVSAI